MKKKNLLLAAVGIVSILGVVSCSSDSKNVSTPLPAATIAIAKSWQISSVTFKRADGVTDSLKYTSADTLGSSRILFGTNYVYTFSDKNNSTLVGPKNDSTLFRYSRGAWVFDQNWLTSKNLGSLNAVPDSLLFQASPDGYNLSGPIYRYKINLLDSLHLQFTYMDSTILNKTTNKKYRILKNVTLVPASN